MIGNSFASHFGMPEKERFDAEGTVGLPQQPVDPDDCATIVIREIAAGEPTAQALQGRIKTIDRIIQELKK